MTYDEVIKGSNLGNQLQSLIEMGKFGTTTLDEQAIAKVRLIESLKNNPNPDKPLFATLSGKTFTPNELIQEIESETQIGTQRIQAEISHMKAVVLIR